RVSIASSNNDHRLGANEAPPAIISIFLGEQLADVFEQIKAGGAKTSKRPGTLHVGVDTLPPLPKHAGDRNRTSPFAFTGNKFEFRAVGSSQSIAGPLVVLNTIVAESLDYIATELEAATGGDASKFNAAVQTVLQKITAECDKVVFNGDGYSEEWHQEAARRGLPNLRNTVDAMPTLLDHANVEVFAKYGVLSEREVHSRFEIYVERYCKDINTESLTLHNMVRVMILPAVYRYQRELAETAAALKAIGKSPDIRTLDKLTGLVAILEERLDKLQGVLGGETGDVMAKAKYFRDTVLPAMGSVRETCDTLEGLVADDLWPLPVYREILFIK
ncbi:MAG: glutamine synthetase type III, partial [Planctomycetia bacterium]